MAITLVLAVVMLATGYVPVNGYGHNVQHSLRWGLDVGLLAGTSIGFAAEVFL